MGENTSFMVQGEEEIKIFPEVFREYYFQDIIMSSGTIILLICFLIQRKEVQINVQEVYHSVVSSRFVSLVNQVPHCMENSLSKTIISTQLPHF